MTTIQNQQSAPHSLEPDLTIAEVARLQKCSEDTVRREISRGNLKAYRFGRLIRVRPTDLKKAKKPVTNAATLRGDFILPENATQ